jgi:hypothetical protein
MRVLLAICFIVAGCASTPAATFTQSLLAAESAADVAVTTTTTLLQAGYITSAQASKIATITDGVNAALSIANSTYTAGNVTSAQSQLQAASTILVTVQGCLTAAQAKQPIDTCLQPLVVSK